MNYLKNSLMIAAIMMPLSMLAMDDDKGTPGRWIEVNGHLSWVREPEYRETSWDKEHESFKNAVRKIDWSRNFYGTIEHLPENLKSLAIKEYNQKIASKGDKLFYGEAFEIANKYLAMAATQSTAQQ